MKYCANCSRQTRDGAKYCPYCGSDRLVVATVNQEGLASPRCARCGKPIEPGERFCTACGQRVGEGGRRPRVPERPQQPLHSRRQAATPPSRRSGPGRRRGVIAFAVILALCLGVGACGFVMGWWPNPWRDDGPNNTVHVVTPRPTRAATTEPTHEAAPRPTQKPTPKSTPKPTPKPKPTPSPTPDSYDVGEILRFGRYEQDGNPDNGPEEIEWVVLDQSADSVLMITRYGIETLRYNEDLTKVTWEKSTLRKWLNAYFVKVAFTDSEQKCLRTVKVSADRNPKYSVRPGEDTKDRAFILSIDEAKQYFASDEARISYPTQHVVAQNIYFGELGSAWWWLRTPGRDGSKASRVRTTGAIKYEGIEVVDHGGTIRPVVVLRID